MNAPVRDLSDYHALIAQKSITPKAGGFEPCTPYPDGIKPFQAALTTWALRRGRSALFAATGLGKTIEELTWARNVVKHSQGKALIFAPLAVAEQIVRVEAPKFGFGDDEVSYSSGALSAKTPIIVTNYERRDKFDLSEYAGVALDESGIIKDHDSKTRLDLTEACRKTPYLLCASATPAPNDWTELGQHAEFLSVLSAKEMLATYFVHDGSVRAKEGSEWRLKSHAEDAFWKWVSTWAVMIRHPRDLGFDEPGYDLPPLHIEQITVPVEYKPADGLLFQLEAKTLQERLAARRESIAPRVAAAAALVAKEPNESWLIWCNLNDEASELARAIPGAVNVQGKDHPDVKTANLLGFAQGKPRILVSKPSIAGRGMNWQNCSRMIFVGLNDSFEQLFQALRRCWRFGQQHEVVAYLIASEREGAVVANLRAKEQKYEAMADAMAEHMRDLCTAEIRGGRQATAITEATTELRLPTWLAA